MIALETVALAATTFGGGAAAIELFLKWRQARRDADQEAGEITDLGQRVMELEAMLVDRQQQPQPAIDPVALYQAIQQLPSQVLRTIQGSINPQQGKVAELLAYAELRQDYDQVVPLGKPVDFIGFKYSTGNPGPCDCPVGSYDRGGVHEPYCGTWQGEARIDFVEVKSGRAQLTPEEKFIQQIVDHKNVQFRLVRVTDESRRLLGATDTESQG